MTKELAYRAVEVADQHEVYFDVHEDYSGRGMYGSTTCAITGDDKNEMIMFVGMALSELLVEGRSQDLTGQALPVLRTDSLGQNCLVY